jgi:cytosolic nonspecific dipeptidase
MMLIIPGYNYRFASISSDLDNHLTDIQAMMEWTQHYIIKLGGKATLVDNPCNPNVDDTIDPAAKSVGKHGTSTLLPPILEGEFMVDPALPTLCVYGHLDVQPASADDAGWHSDPFVLTERNGQLFGRGSTDDKGPALSWLWVVAAYQQLNETLPVNLKLVYEGMEESGSIGIMEWIHKETNGFLSDVDCFCISDNVSVCRHRLSTYASMLALARHYLLESCASAHCFPFSLINLQFSLNATKQCFYSTGWVNESLV